MPQSLWFVGWSLFARRRLHARLHACWLFVHDRRGGSTACYGPLTLDEEIDAETGGIGAPRGSKP